ncbi:TPA: sulfite exporter TauE/SafE family protein [Providencia alcalifaciens]
MIFETDFRDIMEIYICITIVAIFAGALSGIVGTGSSLILLPILINIFGPKSAMPIMAIAAIIGNISRIVTWWREVDWRATLVYSLPGIPAASMGEVDSNER